MKLFIKTIIILILAAAVYSLIPVAVLYLGPNPKPYTNEEAAKSLEGNSGDHFGFIVLGDNHSGLIFNDSSTLKLIRNINREDRFKKLPIDFVAIAGDVTLGGSRRDYNTFNKIRAAVRWPVLAAFGNHDDDKRIIELFKQNVGDLEFSFNDRNSYFIIVDNGAGDMSDEQFAGFEDELAKSLSYRHRFVIAHKPPISPYLQSWYRQELNPWSGRFMKLCEQYKVDIVFCGHEHMFKAETFGGVKYITSGGGGMLTHFPASDGGFLHYLVVRVSGDYIDYEVRKVFPPLWEFLAYYMWKDIFYFLKGIFL